MSLYGVQSFMFRLKQDAALQAALKEKDARAFEGFALDESERAALLAGEVAELYRKGAHPLLLAPYSRFVGISAARYKELMAEVRGTRQFRS